MNEQRSVAISPKGIALVEAWMKQERGEPLTQGEQALVNEWNRDNAEDTKP